MHGVHVHCVHSLLHSCLQATVAVADFTAITCIVVWLIKAVISGNGVTYHVYDHCVCDNIIIDNVCACSFTVYSTH